MRKIVYAAAAVALVAWPVVAQNAEAGKEYDITIAAEDNNQWYGNYGQASMGDVQFFIANAKADQKYHVKVTAVLVNQYTGEKQASCDFQQTGGDYKGKCIDAP